MENQPDLTKRTRLGKLRSRKLWFWVVLIAALLIGGWWWLSRPTPAPDTAAPPAAAGAATTPTPTPTPTSTPRATQTAAAKNVTSGGAAPASTPSPTPTSTPTTAPTPELIAAGADNGDKACKDGELLFRDTYPEGMVSPRVPLGEAERENIVELSWPGNGFGGLDRAILVTPRLGPVWGVNVTGAQTISARGFCGWGDEVTRWAVSQHVPSLQQASRDINGAQPVATEIGVFRLDYEAGALIEIVPGATGVAEGLLERIDVTFSEGAVHSAQPLTLKK